VRRFISHSRIYTLATVRIILLNSGSKSQFPRDKRLQRFALLYPLDP
jgi:hypothetical protein